MEQVDFVNPKYYLNRPHEFPWHELGLDRPHSGPLRSYLCDVARKICDANEREFLRGCTRRELERYAKNYGGTPSVILAFCDKFGEPDDRYKKEEHVLKFIYFNEEFVKYMHQRLNSLYRQGLFHPPEAALTGEERP